MHIFLCNFIYECALLIQNNNYYRKVSNHKDYV